MFKAWQGFVAVSIVVLAAAPRIDSQGVTPSSLPSDIAAPSPTPATQPQTAQKSLADFAREQREKKNNGGEPAASGESRSNGKKGLAEIAKELAANRRTEVKVTVTDSKKLFSEIDEIMDFAASDSGLPRRSAVNHRLVGQDDVNRHTAEFLADLAETQRMERSEMVLKKFGFFPRNFNLRNFLLTASNRNLGGFYEPKTKTMNLVNWVGLEEQRPIMAHELTHALQDQNYNLMVWEHWSPRAPAMRVSAEDGVESDARRAVVEGQAMLVFFDYLLKPYGRTLASAPGAQEFIEGALTSTYDTSLVIHNAPLLLKESAIFPYREGVMFELELLRKGGQDMAFAGAFDHPPLNTHEILHPDAYLRHEKLPGLTLPDLSPVLAGNYDIYDSGTIGELDARILAQELGTENDMFTIAPNWLGGAYVAVARKSAGAAVRPSSTADVALLYVSHWKTEEAAQRLLEVYQKAFGRRVTVVDTKPWLPAGCAAECAGHNAVRVNTSEGPVFLELVNSDTLFVAQGFSEETANGLRQLVLHSPGVSSPRAGGADLSLSFLGLPAFRSFQQVVERDLIESIVRSMAQ